MSFQSSNPNKVTSSLFTVFVLSYVHLTKISTGFPATTRGVSTNYKPNVTQLESGYLKSTLLIKVRVVFLFLYFILSVFTGIFASPSSAKNLVDEESDTENVAPTKSQKISSNNSVRRNVASKVHLNDRLLPDLWHTLPYRYVSMSRYPALFYAYLSLQAPFQLANCGILVFSLWWI